MTVYIVQNGVDFLLIEVPDKAKEYFEMVWPGKILIEADSTLEAALLFDATALQN